MADWGWVGKLGAALRWVASEGKYDLERICWLRYMDSYDVEHWSPC